MSIDASTTNTKWYQGKSGRQKIGHGMVQIVLVFLSFVFSIPLLWVVSTSFKFQDRVFTHPIQWIPNPVNWTNYGELLTALDFNGTPGIYFFAQNLIKSCWRHACELFKID